MLSSCCYRDRVEHETRTYYILECMSARWPAFYQHMILYHVMSTKMIVSMYVYTAIDGHPIRKHTKLNGIVIRETLKSYKRQQISNFSTWYKEYDYMCIWHSEYTVRFIRIVVVDKCLHSRQTPSAFLFCVETRIALPKREPTFRNRQYRLWLYDLLECFNDRFLLLQKKNITPFSK